MALAYNSVALSYAVLPLVCQPISNLAISNLAISNLASNPALNSGATLRYALRFDRLNKTRQNTGHPWN
jgi:hypothetical protein